MYIIYGFRDKRYQCLFMSKETSQIIGRNFGKYLICTVLSWFVWIRSMHNHEPNACGMNKTCTQFLFANQPLQTLSVREFKMKLGSSSAFHWALFFKCEWIVKLGVWNLSPNIFFVVWKVLNWLPLTTCMKLQSLSNDRIQRHQDLSPPPPPPPRSRYVK